MFSNFTLDKVRLTDRYFAFRRNLVKKYIIEFDIHRLMHTFKINGGIPSDAEPLGGGGKMLSAALEAISRGISFLPVPNLHSLITTNY